MRVFYIITMMIVSILYQSYSPIYLFNLVTCNFIGPMSVGD